MARTMTENKLTEKKDLFEDLELYDPECKTIPFMMGAPGPSAIRGCKEIMIEATQKTMDNAEDERYIFQYGPTKGDPEFLNELSKFLTLEYGNKVHSKDLMVTAGATQGLHLTATVLFGSEFPVFVEDPTYFIAIKMLKLDLGFQVYQVPMEEDGINTKEFEKALKEMRPKFGNKEKWKSPFWCMLYTMTVYHNPTGINTSPEKCKELIRIAREYDVLLFVEDVYNLLHYGDGRPPKRLIEYDNSKDSDFKGHVLSNGTFSKIFAPGMRLGWIEAQGQILPLLAKCNTVWSGGSFNHYTSRILSTALNQGSITTRLESLRNMYSKRMQLMCQLIRDYFPKGTKFYTPQGAFFIWIALPSNVDSSELLTIASNVYKVNFLPGRSASPTQKFGNYIRLSISFCEYEEIEVGMTRLGKAIEDYMKTKQAPAQEGENI